MTFLNGFPSQASKYCQDFWRWAPLGETSDTQLIIYILQTDPEKRTTVQSLLRDPWVMKDSKTSISWRSKIEVIINAISRDFTIDMYL